MSGSSTSEASTVPAWPMATRRAIFLPDSAAPPGAVIATSTHESKDGFPRAMAAWTAEGASVLPAGLATGGSGTGVAWAGATGAGAA